MFVSEFSRLAKLNPDTVRFYVKSGILRPERSRKGGRHAYQVFSERDLEVVEIVRVCQALGLSLNEIATILDDLRSNRTGATEIIAFMEAQRDRIDRKINDLKILRRFVQEKADWFRSGGVGQSPRLGMLAAARVDL